MSRFNKFFLSILVAQAVCLCVGLWIHDRFASADWSEQSRLRSVASTNDSGSTKDSDHEKSATGVTSAVGRSHRATHSTANHHGQLISNVFTFVWVMALQGVWTFFLLNKYHVEQDTEKQKHYHESLSKTRDLVQTRDAIIFGLAQLAESRDSDTGLHLERIALYSTKLASAIRKDERFRKRISPAFVRLIGISSALHDIGKVAVADSILLKAGPLTQNERNAMQLHAERGASCISKIERRLGRSNFLQMAKEIASAHHERWDGQGYPKGLRGEEIPLAARIVSIADVYDALRSRRSYKEPMSHEETIELMSKLSGSQFDPDLVEIFLKINYQFQEIPESFDTGVATDRLTGASALQAVTA